RPASFVRTNLTHVSQLLGASKRCNPLTRFHLEGLIGGRGEPGPQKSSPLRPQGVDLNATGDRPPREVWPGDGSSAAPKRWPRCLPQSTPLSGDKRHW